MADSSLYSSISGIYKHAGKYLKNVVTNNPKVKDLPLIKNSGTLVVYNPDPYTDAVSGALTELWLGNTFLAAGYGFNSSTREVLQSWVDDDVVNSISGARWNNTQAISGSYATLLSGINSKISISGGKITDTYIHFKDEYGNWWPDNPTGINISQFLQYDEPAKYKDLSVNKITKTVEVYNDIDGSENVFTENENGKIYVPFGSIIKKINVTLEGNTNDSNGISGPNMIVHFNHILKNNKIETVSGMVYASVESYLIPRSATGPDIDFKYNVEGYYNDRKQFIVDEGSNELFANMTCTVKETNRLLDYPLLKEKFGIQIKSAENKIYDHDIEINTNVTVEGKHLYYYSYRTTNAKSTLLQRYVRGGFIEDVTILDLTYDPDSPKKYILLAIPVKYEITKIELFDLSTNMMHNISGCTKRYSHKDIVKGVSQISFAPITYHTQLHYDIYEILYSDTFKSNIRLFIHTEERSYSALQEYEIVSGVYRSPQTNVFDIKNYTYVIDDDYNSFHWLHYSNDKATNDPNDSQQYLKEYLKESYTTIS